jgi:hypothetical protein
MKKRVLLTDNGTELGFHLAHGFIENNFQVDMITDIPMKHENVNSYKVDWSKVTLKTFDKFISKVPFYEKNKFPYDVIYFNHFINGGPSETEFLPYVDFSYERWEQANIVNVVSTFVLVKELSKYFKVDTKVVWMLRGLYDYNWKENFKYGTSCIFENSRISLLKSFTNYMPGTFLGLNIGGIFNETTEEQSIKAFEIINTIQKVTKDDNGSVIFRNGQKLLL